MIVARQFIAWNSSIENPSRRARSDPYPRLINRPDRSTPIGPNHTVPSGTDSRLNLFQAMNCLATIIQPLRDKVRQLPLGQNPAVVRGQNRT
jgi:hypothetical protein